MAGISPTQRTLALLREQGRVCGVVERFNAFVGPYGIRQDFLGFADIICVDPEKGIIAVQSCGQAFSAHKKKILEERTENVTAWIKHAPIELIGWRKVKLERGGKALRWKPRIGDVKLVDGKLTIEERP